MPTKPMPTAALGLMLVPAGDEVQRISAGAVANDPRYCSEVVARRPRFRHRGRLLEVVRWFPRRGFVVTECYRHFHAAVLSLRLARGAGRMTLRRRGFRPVMLYLKDGGYFKRVWASGHSRGNPILRPVVVWQRNGDFFMPQRDAPDNERRRAPLS